jgi:hypothetical protein
MKEKIRSGDRRTARHCDCHADRHCERSAAIHGGEPQKKSWIATSLRFFP